MRKTISAEKYSLKPYTVTGFLSQSGSGGRTSVNEESVADTSS